MSPEPWNTHALHGHNFDALNEALISLQEDHRAYGTRFVDMMFKHGEASREEREWMVKEHLKTPTPVAVAAYSDYVMRDYTGVLKTITVPVLVAVGDSIYMAFGPKTGQYVADAIPKGRLAVFENSGHLPFYEEAASFNEALADLARG
jgi:pimeloyl-ACP methyl ester carboxylesterase